MSAGGDVRSVRGPDGLRSVVLSAWERRLFRDGRLLDPGCVRGEEVLKRTRSRVVRRVELACGEQVLVKEYPARPGLDGVLAGLRTRPAADAEWRVGRRLAAAGLPVAEPVACGIRVRLPGFKAERVVVTRWVAGARSLGERARATKARSPEARRLVVAVARLVRRLHDAGVRLMDPHQENFLVRDGPAGPEVLAVDLADVRAGAPLDDRARLKSLALHYQTLGVLVPRRLRALFVATYLADRSRAEVRRVARAVEERGAARHRRYARRRSRAALATNRRFERRRAGRLVWNVRRAAAGAGIRALLADPEAAFAAPDAVLKDGRTTTVVAWRGFVVKRFNQRKRRNRLGDRLRGSRARRAFRTAWHLELSGLPTAEVCAAGEERRLGLVHRSYLVTRHLPDVETVDRRLARLPPDRRRVLIDDVARLVRRLHQRGFVHRDLKAANVLVSPDGSLHLVDLDGVAAARRPARGRARSDLERLLRDLRSRSGLSPDEEHRLLAVHGRA